MPAKDTAASRGDDARTSNAASQKIDQRIRELGDWCGNVLARIRAPIRDADPDVVEEWKWQKAASPGTAVWSHDGGITHVQRGEPEEIEPLEAPMTDASGDRWLGGDAYEAFMGRWSRPLARRFLEWLSLPVGGHWLDVGCGTGALTAAICDVGAPASVVACDPSASFVEHARKSVTDARVSFVVASADDLPARAGGFDAIVSAFVLNFVPDAPRAVAAMRERLRPGGTVAAAVWDYADGMEFLRAFWDEAVALDPQVAALDEGRRFPLCRQGALAATFEAAGLQRVESGAVEIPTVFATFDDYWRPFLGDIGPAPGHVTSLDPDRRAALADRLRTRLATRGGEPIRLRARAWTARGVLG